LIGMLIAVAIDIVNHLKKLIVAAIGLYVACIYLKDLLG